MPQTIFNLPDAVTWFSTDGKKPLSEHAILRFVETEDLPVCFKYKGELTGVSIESADGTEHLATPVPFSGILRSLLPPETKDVLVSSSVQAAEIDNGFSWSTTLTTRKYGGKIKPGFSVIGWLGFENIPAAAWLFHIDDLRALLANAESTVSAEPPVPVATPAGNAELSTPWLVADPRDPIPVQSWYIPARYFARELIKSDSTLLLKMPVLAGKVSALLAKAGIFKRGGKNAFSSGTVLKALSNVSLG